LIKNEISSIDPKLPEILIYGLGNPGRQDDALGILLVEKIEAWVKENNYSYIITDQNYQLNIEDAEYISNYDLVIFLDASVDEIESVLIEPVVPDLKTNFSMHSLTPAYIVGLCNQLFHNIPETYQLHIKGYKFEFMKPLSRNAEKNLASAFTLLTTCIQQYLFSGSIYSN